MDGDDGGFDYGREILKQQDYDTLLERRKLPYNIFPLFLQTKSYSYA